MDSLREEIFGRMRALLTWLLAVTNVTAARPGVPFVWAERLRTLLGAVKTLCGDLTRPQFEEQVELGRGMLARCARDSLVLSTTPMRCERTVVSDAVFGTVACVRRMTPGPALAPTAVAQLTLGVVSEFARWWARAVALRHVVRDLVAMTRMHPGASCRQVDVLGVLVGVRPIDESMKMHSTVVEQVLGMLAPTAVVSVAVFRLESWLADLRTGRSLVYIGFPGVECPEHDRLFTKGTDSYECPHPPPAAAVEGRLRLGRFVREPLGNREAALLRWAVVEADSCLLMPRLGSAYADPHQGQAAPPLAQGVLEVPGPRPAQSSGSGWGAAPLARSTRAPEAATGLRPSHVPPTPVPGQEAPEEVAGAAKKDEAVDVAGEVEVFLEEAEVVADAIKACRKAGAVPSRLRLELNTGWMVIHQLLCWYAESARAYLKGMEVLARSSAPGALSLGVGRPRLAEAFRARREQIAVVGRHEGDMALIKDTLRRVASVLADAYGAPVPGLDVAVTADLFADFGKVTDPETAAGMTWAAWEGARGLLARDALPPGGSAAAEQEVGAASPTVKAVPPEGGSVLANEVPPEEVVGSGGSAAELRAEGAAEAERVVREPTAPESVAEAAAAADRGTEAPTGSQEGPVVQSLTQLQADEREKKKTKLVARYERFDRPASITCVGAGAGETPRLVLSVSAPFDMGLITPLIAVWPSAVRDGVPSWYACLYGRADAFAWVADLVLYLIAQRVRNEGAAGAEMTLTSSCLACMDFGLSVCCGLATIGARACNVAVAAYRGGVSSVKHTWSSGVALLFLVDLLLAVLLCRAPRKRKTGTDGVVPLETGSAERARRVAPVAVAGRVTPVGGCVRTPGKRGTEADGVVPLETGSSERARGVAPVAEAGRVTPVGEVLRRSQRKLVRTNGRTRPGEAMFTNMRCQLRQMSVIRPVEHGSLSGINEQGASTLC